MEVLSYELDLSEIKPYNKTRFDVGAAYLWVLHADKIPPHIGVSYQGKYFSLKSNGKDEFKSISSVFSVIDRKEIKTLLFKLSDTINFSKISDVYASYSSTKTGKITCLNPIKEVLNYSEPRMLVELLAELESDGLIDSIIGVNTDENFKGIQNYDVRDIHSRLTLLENA